MTELKQDPRKALAANVKTLRESRNWTQVQLANKAGTSQRTASNIENPDGPSPTHENIEKIAGAFGLQGWMLNIPNLAGDLLNGDLGIARVVRNYLDSDRDGRNHIIRISEREAEYNERRAS